MCMCVRDVIYKVFWFIVIYQVKNAFKIKKSFKKRKRKMRFMMVYGEKSGREEKKTIL